MNRSHLNRIKKGNHTRGFTLLELLVAMGILSLVILLLSQIFSQTVRTMEMGYTKSDQNLNARAVMDFIARDVESAIANEHIGFMANDNPSGVAAGNYQLSLFTARHTENAPREAQPIAYYVNQNSNTLQRTYTTLLSSGNGTGINNFYTASDPDYLETREGFLRQNNANTLADGIVEFEVLADTDGDGDIDGSDDAEYKSWDHGDRLPPFVDIKISFVGDKDLIKVHRGIMNISDDYIQSRKQTYVRRIYLSNSGQ